MLLILCSKIMATNIAVDTFHIKVTGNVDIIRNNKIGYRSDGYVQYILNGYKNDSNKGYMSFLFDGVKKIEFVELVNECDFISTQEIVKEYERAGNNFFRQNTWYLYEMQDSVWVRFKLKGVYMGANLRNDYTEGDKQQK